ncbi:hypothetical protein [Flavobacterium sp.]|uniref:hypothetical protein n=1 Tax=Flavobacterium sp. TaxID=239 RepID=UPI0025C0D4E4|nr:hypothetical protein [Flavobacterium sp.]MBA4153745.1 hypothetical protein [Flavobacterium sp.]
MKKIFKLSLFLFASIAFTSCSNDTSDTLTDSATQGGLLTVQTTDLTYAQGSAPTDAFPVTISGFQGREKIQTVDVYKQFITFDGVMSEKIILKTLTFPNVDQMETVSFTFDYNELIAGLSINGVPLPADDSTLNIGDKWELSYMSNLDNGNAHMNNPKTNVTVSCGSFLKGLYSNSTVRTETGVVYTFAQDNVREIGDGLYLTSYIGPYYCAGQTPGTSGNTIQLPAGTNAGYVFKDVCGVLGLETQNLAAAFTNEVRQSAAQKALSSVDLTTGVITIHYSIFFTGNTVERPFITTLTPL